MEKSWPRKEVTLPADKKKRLPLFPGPALVHALNSPRPNGAGWANRYGEKLARLGG